MGKNFPFHYIYKYIKEEIAMSAEYQNNKLIKCEVCGLMYKSITNTHLKNKHNLTTTEYKRLFPDTLMISAEHLAKLGEWVYSDKNKKHWLNQQRIQSNSEKRKTSVRLATQCDEYKQKQSEVMKKYVGEHPESIMWQSIKGSDHHHYKKSNWQRWSDKYGEDIADEKLTDWKRKNKIPNGSRNTKIELKVNDILNKNNIEYVHQYDKISSFYVDFYLPMFNLVLEVDGDYWHANPKRYRMDELIKYPGNRIVTAESVWNRDKIRADKIRECGYNVVRIFGSDITENNVLNLINNFDKDIVRTHGKP